MHTRVNPGRARLLVEDPAERLRAALRLRARPIGHQPAVRGAEAALAHQRRGAGGGPGRRLLAADSRRAAEARGRRFPRMSALTSNAGGDCSPSLLARPFSAHLLPDDLGEHAPVFGFQQGLGVRYARIGPGEGQPDPSVPFDGWLRAPVAVRRKLSRGGARTAHGQRSNLPPGQAGQRLGARAL